MSKERLRYPPIPESLIECLYRDFPNTLPRRELSTFELGRLIGQQDIIEKLKFETKEEERE